MSFFESISNMLSGDSDESLTDRAKSLVRGAVAKVDEWKKQISEKVDNAAAKVAETCQDWTGKETTAADVKRTAIVGAAIGTMFAAGPAMASAMRQQQMMQNMAGGVGGSPESAAMMGMPNGDPSADWEQDHINYDQMQYDHLQDHIANQQQLDSVIDDQISYNQSMDFGGEY